MKNNIKELNMEEMEKVSGGSIFVISASIFTAAYIGVLIYDQCTK